MFRLIRTNLVVILVVVFYLVTVLLAMVVLDKVIYQSKKHTLIFEQWERFLSMDSGEINLLTVRYVQSHDPQQQAAIREDLQHAIDREFERANGVYRISAYGADNVLLAEHVDLNRFSEFNGWRNSLFFRDFDHMVRWEQASFDGRVEIHYTTPVNVPVIEELSHRFRMIALLIWVSITVGFVLALKKIILPIRRVSNQVQERGADLLRQPATALERSYNAVATEALAARLSQRTTELVQTPSLWTSAEFDPLLIEAVVDCFQMKAVALIAVEPTSGQPHFRACKTSPRIDEQIFKEQISKASGLWDALEPSQPVGLLRRAGETLGMTTAISLVIETASSRLGLVVSDVGDWSVLPRWQRRVFEAITAEVRRGLLQMPVFRDYLFRQKSEANISLARNLGHDLTNVIATSKFDILAIQNWLKRRQAESPEGNAPTSKRELILAESVQGLLNTTKFMQEIVNIYRAFSYMDEPRWESVDINSLIAHLCDLFRLTLSRRVEVHESLCPENPQMVCEPRLVQLALFNLLNNANQAIKRLSENAEGTIDVATRLPEGDGMLEITIHDSGPGIRDAAGNLLDGEKLYQIFFLGITTRREGEEKGEGLGLNWVWSIVRDFHGGKVEPQNHPDGGAMFRLLLPLDGRGQSTQDETPPTQNEMETPADA